MAIVDFSNEHYVTQLDADTITPSKPEEVSLRGRSGFAGLSKNRTWEQLKSISKSFEGKLGIKRWYEWGDGQASSNVVIANPINRWYYRLKNITISSRG